MVSDGRVMHQERPLCTLPPRETMAFFALIIGCYALSALCFAAAKRVLLALLSGALAVVSFPLALFIGYVVEMLQSQQ